MQILILITTYNRPKMLLALLRSILNNSQGYNISLLIIDDCSTKNYSSVHNFLRDHFSDSYHYYKTELNYGKSRYWKIIDYLYSSTKEFDCEYIIQLPDDVTLVDDFFSKAITTFNSITDPNLACLNILNDFSRNGKSFWTNIKSGIVNFNGTSLLRTGWVDMCFIANSNYFKFLEYKINHVSVCWSNDPNLSSGVGKQISERLTALNKNIYQVRYSLVIHDDHLSVMHPQHRNSVKLLSNHYANDKITASMATMPGRELALQEAVASIIDQVDELHIYMNNIDHYPEFSSNTKIKFFLSKDHKGDLGDAGKFYTADSIVGYHFTVDDDIIYPPDYVVTLINYIEKNKRNIVVSCHGRLFEQLPVASYYKNHSAAYSCLRNVTSDVYAHVIGTGVLAYHTDTLKISLDEFKFSNMADIWFSKYCNEKNIPRLIINHKAGWIKLSKKYDETGSIFTHQSVNDSVQTKVTNSVSWSTVL